MRYIADENIPLEAVKSLREKGIDLFSVKEIEPGAPDDKVLLLSINYGRILEVFCTAKRRFLL